MILIRIMNSKHEKFQSFIEDLIKDLDVKFAAIISRIGLLEASILPKKINKHKFAAMVATMIESLEQVSNTYGSKSIAKITVSEMKEEQLFVGVYNDDNKILAIISPRKEKMTQNNFLTILKIFHNYFY